MDVERNAGQGPLEVAPTLNLVARLQRDRHFRDSRKLYYIEGVRNFVAALDQGCQVETLVYSERLLISPIARKLVRQLKRAGVSYARLSPEEFRSVSITQRAAGVGAILHQRAHSLDQLDPAIYPCWVVLDLVRRPGNFGTLIRTAAATGGAGFILLNGKLDQHNPSVIRASMGAFFGQTFVRAGPEQLRRWIKKYNLQVSGATPEGTLAYDQAHYSHPAMLALGEERAGLSPVQRALCDQTIRIPMLATSDSLNLGVAGSLLLYEIARSRQEPVRHSL